MKKHQIPGPGFSGHHVARQLLLAFDTRHGHPDNGLMVQGRIRADDDAVNLIGMSGEITHCTEMRGGKFIDITESHLLPGGSRCSCLGGFLDHGMCCGCGKDYWYN